jgi:SAM-dependent methyltransferase/uncharacterized protein YbaR (Trm112 family)
VELVCPRDRAPLEWGADSLACGGGHDYPLVDGIPVLLVEEEDPTHASCWVSLERSGSKGRAPADRPEIEPLVQDVIAATCGNLYRHLIGKMEAYPIPDIRLPPGDGRTFLEVGCNWGRWCVAASRRGYRATGIDPSLDAIRAALRVTQQLEAEADYVVGDARHLPFPDASFDVVFSYSVFQHFTKADAIASFVEIGRTLRPGGLALVQMANVYGARSLFNQLRERRFREPRTMFDVRYWSPRELGEEFRRAVGPTTLAVDGFLTLNPQPADLPLLPRRYRALVRSSEGLRRLSERLPFLVHAADSLYVAARK